MAQGPSTKLQFMKVQPFYLFNALLKFSISLPFVNFVCLCAVFGASIQRPDSYSNVLELFVYSFVE